jgi:hypothetical protein
MTPVVASLGVLLLAVAILAQGHEDLIVPEATPDDLIPVRPAHEPRREAELRIVERDTRVDQTVSFQGVAFDLPPEAVLPRLARFKMERTEGADAAISYTGRGPILGEDATIVASFTPTTRRLYAIAVVVTSRPWEAQLVAAKRFDLRRRTLTEKYGQPAKETYQGSTTELAWQFRDGQIRCEWEGNEVRVVYFRLESVERALKEGDDLKKAKRSQLKDDL